MTGLRLVGLRLILVRHGQTDSNVRMEIDSVPPGPPLNEQGRRQAEELADALAAEQVVGVYASTALRARQTARPVADRHGLAVRVAEGLHEVFVGDLDGTADAESRREFADVFRAWDRQGDLDRPMPGGETGREAVDRCTAALADIVAQHEHGVVVVVSHGGLLRLVGPILAPNLRTHVAGLSLLANTARIVLEPDPARPGGWQDRWRDGWRDGWHCVEWAGVRLGPAT